MTFREFDKNIIYTTPPTPFHPKDSFDGTEMFLFDDRIMRGAFPFMCAWFAGPWRIEETMKPHCHHNDEVLMFIGSDPENPSELGGEVEFFFKDDRYILNKSCLIFVPGMVQHAPMRPIRVNDPKKPILFVGTTPFSGEQDKTYYYSRDPKWSQYKDPPETPMTKWMD
jgi:hypothetical protein